MDQPQPTGTVRWREILNRQYGLALALVCLGIWLHAADSLLVATMVPQIVAEIGGAELIAWTVALYGIGSIIAGASSGLLTLHYGLRGPMTFAALLFALGCGVSALAPEMWVVLVGRLFQGLGGGGLMAMAFVAVSSLFPRRLTARAMGAISTLWGVSAFIGPLVGGLFVEYGTWQGGFWFFAIQAILMAIWIQFTLRKSKKQEDRPHIRFPFWRLSWLSLGVFLIAYGGIEVSVLQTSLFVGLGVMALVIFLFLDGKKSENRLLPHNPLNLLTPLGAALVLVLAFSTTTIAITVYGPYLITVIHHEPPIVGGYVMACLSIGWSIVAFLASGVAEKHDARMIFSGMLVITASLPGYAYSLPNGPVWLIGVFAAIQGGGFGMAWTFILRRAMKLAPANEYERVSSAIPTLQRVGFALGAAYAGILANAAGLSEQADISTIHVVAWLLPLASLPAAAIGLVATYQFTRRRSGGATP
ncbi:MFS transporter [Sneathiella sp. CAU 1612]|uniref:MFS transporter n=1 Tax=Sneathiella sedimenti TaxID=2816034 RepID=A0ABS3F2I2_9PROT|nr:MFS transporter [Sneathiella sedimenti]MBO0332714.1 MFS transporter [Sneathiella sedimenti]